MPIRRPIPAGRRRVVLAVAAWAALAGPAFAAAADPGELVAAIDHLRQAGEWTRALAVCEQALRDHPRDAELLRRQVLILADAGAVGRARELARELPADPVLLARLDADVAAQGARRAARDPVAPDADPYAAGDAAVRQLDAVVAGHAAAPAVVRRARLDRLVALQAAGRSAEAVADYDAMSAAERETLPPYVLRPLAEALLDRQRPEEAARLLERAGPATPGSIPESESDPAIVLMYAYSEAGQYAKAKQTIDTAAAAQPVWLRKPGQSKPAANPHRSENDLNAALLRGYAGLLADANARLAAGVHEAPASANWRRELGNNERSRGWPRRAEADLAIARGLDPQDTGVRLGQLETLRDLGDYADVEPGLENLEAHYPRNAQVQRARRAWDRERGWQFDAAQTFGRGNTPDYGDRDQDTLAALASPLLADHWRVYAIARHAQASLPEGDAHRTDAGLGVRGQWRGVQAYLQALPTRGTGDDPTAVEAGFDWAIGDHWAWSTDASSSGADIPLRARYYGIHGSTLDSTVQWRASDLLAARLGVQAANFSDGNRRRAADLGITGRVLTRPRLQLDLGADLYASHNTLDGTAYFNPRRDGAATVTAHLDHVLVERYGRTWHQLVDLAVGSYAQQGQSAGWVADVGYGQAWQPHEGLGFGWRLGWHSQPYDGRRETRATLELTLHWGE
ncbi:poly-beta-1,6 N-acetyl-D-glucosamine export porin PgaA [Frateuria edaphi]|uniref:poly-beta-1,6 N-acetyl-D-glucosamine export porin PgaA n=1 Tax=Frateuria edaphi TaxID=2898793 RepID=UPI001E5D1AA6|nr:poly-beta-1,6 N-acetyl-D-glucosamine export porin PgaA [Frateuria edaphi]UGB45269.1 poly-beta-1,6 N-acetyl-D-glucosamine export porin PgaA [Frateuria edaphi]